MQIEEKASIRLKKGKDRPLRQNHHWIFSGAISNLSKTKEQFADVFSHEGEKLGIAMLGSGQSIIGHMLAFNDETIEEALFQRMETAISMRKSLFDLNVTNAFRLIHAEGDQIPGLIIDSYNGVLVIQISHPAIEALKPLIIENLITLCQPRTIIEKSTSFLRKKEGLNEVRQLLHGEDLKEIEVLENSIRYFVPLYDGQKTGLFLDQREMRSLVRDLSNQKKVLNCFAYTGGFSISALCGGATFVDSVEISKKCEPWVQNNLQLNQLPSDKHRFIPEDAIDFVAKSPLDYDLVILDPPAFVKHKESINRAFRAYKDLNKTAISKMKPGSFLLTCSCSYHVGDELFQNILFRASLEANRKVKIIEKHRLAHDHPISIFHPESSYLKSLLLYIS